MCAGGWLAHRLPLPHRAHVPRPPPPPQELHHPNVVRLLEVVPHKRTLALVFEFCGGGDLEQLIRQHAAAAAGAGAEGTAAGVASGAPAAPGAGVGAGTNSGGGREGSATGAAAEAAGTITPGAAKAYLQMLLQALAYCHSQVRLRVRVATHTRVGWGAGLVRRLVKVYGKMPGWLGERLTRRNATEKAALRARTGRTLAPSALIP